MAYRDDLDAALTRAESLAREVDRLTAEREADDRETEDLRERLGKAERELARLRGLRREATPRTKRVWNVVLVAAACLAVATLVAGAQSESDGVSVSYLAAPVLGLGIGGRWRGVWAGLAGALLALLLVGAFYASIWPSL